MPDKKRLQDALSKPAGGNAQIQRGTPYQVGLTPAPRETELPAQFGALPAPLQEIARQYIGARRRSGEALLDMARWIAEARRLAEHGEWQIFLEATSTSSDTAERLLNIHSRALENQDFADAISRNWLSQSAAALLARPSTPSEVIGEVLESPTPPTKADVEQKIRSRRGASAAPAAPQIPHSAEFEAGGYTFEEFQDRRAPATHPPLIRDDLLEALTRIAEQEGRGINEVLEDAIKAYLTPRQR